MWWAWLHTPHTPGCGPMHLVLQLAQVTDGFGGEGSAAAVVTCRYLVDEHVGKRLYGKRMKIHWQEDVQIDREQQNEQLTAADLAPFLLRFVGFRYGSDMGIPQRTGQ